MVGKACKLVCARDWSEGQMLLEFGGGWWIVLRRSRPRGCAMRVSRCPIPTALIIITNNVFDKADFYCDEETSDDD